MHPEFTSQFGTLLKAARKSRRRTQLEVALDLHVDHSVISRWENGTEYPKIAQVNSIKESLCLTEVEFEAIYFAWKREAEAVPAEFLNRGTRPLELIDFAEKSIGLAREMRKVGQPRLAILLCERDTRVLFDRIREQSWSRMHPEMLARVGELLVEQCKAGLDYLPRSEVRGGALQESLARLRIIEEACRTEITHFYAELANEGVTYVGGNVEAALGQSLDMVEHLESIPPVWRAEVLRAAAINAGKVRQRDSLARIEILIERLLAASRTSIGIGEEAFLLEGLARGWGSLDPEHGNMIITQAWAARDSTTGSESISQLRHVQLVRSEAEIISVDMEGADIPDTVKKIRNALGISMANHYDRYVDQLNDLLRRFSADTSASNPTG
jgi:transcriptional regulator with XRE-family HTH domain